MKQLYLSLPNISKGCIHTLLTVHRMNSIALPRSVILVAHSCLVYIRGSSYYSLVFWTDSLQFSKRLWSKKWQTEILVIPSKCQVHLHLEKQTNTVVVTLQSTKNGRRSSLQDSWLELIWVMMEGLSKALVGLTYFLYFERARCKTRPNFPKESFSERRNGLISLY